MLQELPPELTRLSHEVISAAIAVHRALGPGYLESVYEEALCVELAERGVPFARQAAFKVCYKGTVVGEGRMDVLVDNRLVLELKAVETTSALHAAQLKSYLQATDRCLGLLINFNVPVLKDGLRRIILSKNLGALWPLLCASAF